jgi:DNA-binding CsgD family transcriptional regulator
LSNSEIRTRLTPQALAAVFISDGGALPFVDLNAIGRSFEYTPAETKLVGELVAGKSLAESANALGIVESTAKTHLHSIFAKSGVNRQVDLVALINRLTPMTRLAG